MLKKVAIRILALIAVLAVLNFIYAATFFPHDLAQKSPEALLIRKTADTTDVYYFGESSNISFAEKDTIQSSISELAARYYPDMRFTTIIKYATHAGIYREWLKELGGRAANVKAVVITMNLRSFDAAWIHSKLETSLRESLVMSQRYPPLVNRFMLSLQAFDNKTDEQREQDMLNEWRDVPLKFPFNFRYRTVAEWDHAMAQGTYLNPDGSWDTEKIALACHYIKSYAFNIDETNPRVKDFDAIAVWAHEANVPVIFNLMAENITYADSLVGKELVFLMRQNRDYLVSRYHRGKCRVVDNLEEVAGVDFIDQSWTTEHYNQRGRMTIAKNLADTLRACLGKKYRSEN
jgi:hypothetical protein